MRHDPKQTSISGVVTAVFAHRFVLEGEDGRFLADLGPEGAHRVTLNEG